MERLGPVLGLILLVTAAPCRPDASHTIDVGGPLDDLLIVSGWYGPEGPYDQFGPIWRSTCRWAAQGAAIRIPLYPDAPNTIAMRAEVRGDDKQIMTWRLDGAEIARLPISGDLSYSATVPSETIGERKWAVLSIETQTAFPAGSDGRDLRVAVDWVRVSAPGPGRSIEAEVFAQAGLELAHISIDQAPGAWRMRYDPNNLGGTSARQKFGVATYDDSAFDVVATDHLPPMRRGDAVWYRAWVELKDKTDEVRAALRLPGAGLEADGQRIAWVNGAKLSAVDGGPSLEGLAAQRLSEGTNFIAVKGLKGPLPRESGQQVLAARKLAADWTDDGFMFHVGPLELTPELRKARALTVTLRAPDGETLAAETTAVADLEGGGRGLPGRHSFAVPSYGQHTLIVRTDAGAEQRIPVQLMGLHLFHWGWYIAGGGTKWNGFKPCSNDYLDQLFGRLDDFGRPHHSICWCGGILAPGTGFHRTEGVDYIARLREAIDSRKLQFVGMPFAPRNICTDFGESLLRGMRKSRELYRSQLGCVPTRFYSHDATMTPQMPQIMQLCGYDTYCIAENVWGQGRSIPNSRDCYMQAPDGTNVRVLDSGYHGISPVQAARRAAQQGKPAVLCNEEFACLDRTVFLEQQHLDTLAEEAIFLKPVSLDQYQQITRQFAREYTYQGDEALCYKGWTGGGEGEVDSEKANRLLEAQLVALENLVAFARWLGLEAPQADIDKWWDMSLRYHECHLHWGNGNATHTRQLREALEAARGQTRRIAGLIADLVSATQDGVTAVNPLGLSRSGLIRFPAQGDIRSLAMDLWRIPVQPDPDEEGMLLASVPSLPSVGYRHWAFSEEAVDAVAVTARRQAEAVILRNSRIRLRVEPDGVISALGGAEGPPTIAGLNRLHLARPADKAPTGLLSTEARPLNAEYYTRVVAAGSPRIMCHGPVMAAVECSLVCEDYPEVALSLRVSLVAHESQARVRLSLNFPKPTVVAPRGGSGPHEGTYVPGIHVDFPMPEGAEPLADMAYCTTDGVLSSTNHETGFGGPFRNGTFNTLSLAAPNSGDYAVLTRGLPDFFALRRPEGRLGMSLGVGGAGCPFNGQYTHEYALWVPEKVEASGFRAQAFMAARSLLVEPVAVVRGAGEGPLPSEGSFLAAQAPGVVIPGVQMTDGRLSCRVVNLTGQPASVKFSSLAKLEETVVTPSGAVLDGRCLLPPGAVREIRAMAR